MSSISSDLKLHELLIAYSFGSFLEGTAGFGTPVAITTSILVVLVFNPLYAAGIRLADNPKKSVILIKFKLNEKILY